MSNTDPAVAAAQRAWHGNSDNDGGDPQLDVDDRRVWDTAEAAAREALAPVAREIERLRGIWNSGEHKSVRVVLDRLSELVHAPEEL